MVRLKPLIASEFIQLEPEIKELLVNSGAVPVNNVFFDLWEDQSDIWLLHGSYGSGKSIFIADYLINKSLNSEYFKCLFGRRVHDTLRGSVHATLCDRIKYFNLQNKFIFSTSPNGSMFIQCKENGNSFHPFGADNIDSLKSFKDPTHIFCEEFDQFEQTDFAVLYSRLRTEGAQLQFIGAFNTEKVHPEHWIKKYFFDKYKEAERDTHSKIKRVFCNYSDNSFIDQAKYEERLWMAAGYDEKKFLQIARGEWGSLDTRNVFAYAFERTKHVVDVLMPDGKQLMQIDKRLPLYFSLDINVDPMTCIVCQFYKMEWLKIIDEYHLKNSNIFELTERIQTDYGEYYKVITGDASARSRDANSKNGRSIILNIKNELKLSDRQLQFPASNPNVKNTRMVMNALFQKHPKIYISSKCLWLIDDLLTVTVDEHGDMDKEKDKTRSHLTDCCRYIMFNYFKGFISI
jgi:PBSX family phage terminase large subunit